MLKYTANIEIGETYLTWHNSGFWGCREVTYIGKGFVSDKYGGKNYFKDIKKGFCDDYDSLPHIWDRAPTIYNKESVIVSKYSEEGKMLQALKEKYDLIVKRKPRKVETFNVIATKSNYHARMEAEAKLFVGIRVHSWDCFAKDVKFGDDVALEKIATQYFLTIEKEDKKHAYAIGTLVEKWIEQVGISEESLTRTINIMLGKECASKLFGEVA